MYLTNRSLPVLVDSPTPRAMIACKPYHARLSLEACATRATIANKHVTRARLGAEEHLAVSACRTCPVGLDTRHALRAHGIEIKTRG